MGRRQCDTSAMSFTLAVPLSDETMATATKTSLENKHFGNSDYVVIIASCSHLLLLLTEHAANGLVEPR